MTWNRLTKLLLGVFAAAALSQTMAPTQVAQVYAQIDGSLCRINKYPGSQLRAQVFCANYNGSVQTIQEIYSSSSTYNTPFMAGMGATLCMIFANPTAVAVTQAPFGAVPANTLAWQCSVNTAAAGPVIPNPGGTGSVSWP